MIDKNKVWDIRFIKMSEMVSTWSSCLRENRQIGSIIVKNKRVLTTGYNGSPSGVQSCKERGECLRESLKVPSGQNLEIGDEVHAEQNAIIQAAKLGVSIDDATLYCTHQPCTICAKMIINAGIKRVVYKNGYPNEHSLSLFKEAGLIIEKIEYTEEEEANA